MYHTLTIAHRGASGEAPENTLAAFQLAIEQKSDGIELDVHLSADGQIIVCHDATIDRTTDGTGRIAEMTLEQLKLADAGSWFSESFKGERLPTLDEVFELVPELIMINIEVKHALSEAQSIVEPLVECLRRHNRIQSVVVSSFDHLTLVKVKEACPETKIGLLYKGSVTDHTGFARSFPYPVYSLHPYFAEIDAEAIRDAIEHGIQVYAWTINQPVYIEQMVKHGVSGIISDYPTRVNNIARKC